MRKEATDSLNSIYDARHLWEIFFCAFLFILFLASLSFLYIPLSVKKAFIIIIYSDASGYIRKEMKENGHQMLFNVVYMSLKRSVYLHGACIYLYVYLAHKRCRNLMVVSHGVSYRVL